MMLLKKHFECLYFLMIKSFSIVFKLLFEVGAVGCRHLLIVVFLLSRFGSQISGRLFAPGSAGLERHHLRYWWYRLCSAKNCYHLRSC